MNQLGFEVQVRSEDTGIKQVGSLKEALELSYKDDTLWKISFSLPNGERVRLVKEYGLLGNSYWVYAPLEIEDLK